jgi:hypothetical protein
VKSRALVHRLDILGIVRSNPPGPIMIALAVVAAVVAVAGFWISSVLKRRRAQALAGVARKYNWEFDLSNSRPFSEQSVFDPFRHGSARTAYNTMRGPLTIGGREFAAVAGDYRYTVSNGKSSTTYHFSYAILRLPFDTPGITLRPERLLDRIEAAVGFSDITFESSEFNKRCCVRSQDKKFAYGVIHPKMMEFLLSAPPPTLSILSCLCCVADGNERWGPDGFIWRIEWLSRFFGLWPEYLTQTQSGSAIPLEERTLWNPA